MSPKTRVAQGERSSSGRLLDQVALSVRARHDGRRMPSLSQRHRPHTFADVTGQSHITEPLRRSLATGHIAHAFLFSGPRGVGKTTTARILSQALVCQSLKEGESCGTCDACKAFQAGELVDVIELDAATHTGVELVREAIIEHARFVPMMGKRKVYILDEAHMLSTSSWNALLKTLEEPPAHAFFIFATTESHKVPATIVSRCQRFDFRRIPDQELAERIRAIAVKEDWKIDEEVIRLIVSRSEGCLRDAETLLGQLSALGESQLTLELAHLIVPPSRLPVAAELFTRWTDKDLAAALTYARELFDTGVPIGPLFDDLLLAIRLLLVAGALPAQAKDWETNEYRVFLPLIGRWTSSELHDLALCVIERRRDIRFGIDPLFLLELTSTVACHRLFGRSGGAPMESAHLQSAEPHHVAHSHVVQIQQPVPIPVPPPVAPVVPQPQSQPEPPVEQTPASLDITSSLPVESIEQPASSPVTQEVSPMSAHVPSVTASTESSDITIDQVRAKWNTVISTVDVQNHSLPFILKISRPEQIEGATIVVRFQYAFHYDKLITDSKHRKVVEDAFKTVFGQPFQLAGIVGDDAAEGGQKKSDMVSNILKAFGGNVVE